MGGGEAGQDEDGGEAGHGEENGEDCGDAIGGSSDEHSEICIAGIEGDDLGEHCGESIGGGVLFEAPASQCDESEASSESVRDRGRISTDGAYAGGGATSCLGVKDGA